MMTEGELADFSQRLRNLVPCLNREVAGRWQQLAFGDPCLGKVFKRDRHGGRAYINWTLELVAACLLSDNHRLATALEAFWSNDQLRRILDTLGERIRVRVR